MRSVLVHCTTKTENEEQWKYDVANNSPRMTIPALFSFRWEAPLLLVDIGFPGRDTLGQPCRGSQACPRRRVPSVALTKFWANLAQLRSSRRTPQILLHWEFSSKPLFARLGNSVFIFYLLWAKAVGQPSEETLSMETDWEYLFLGKSTCTRPLPRERKHILHAKSYQATHVYYFNLLKNQTGKMLHYWTLLCMFCTDETSLGWNVERYNIKTPFIQIWQKGTKKTPTNGKGCSQLDSRR